MIKNDLTRRDLGKVVFGLSLPLIFGRCAKQIDTAKEFYGDL
jgi:hypothetical protein|tara:strand:- start:699 stop:824 length:126 start_codon:yes stop_codon:yes gene_type:complete